jgi:ceramide glucosyltransferase
MSTILLAFELLCLLPVANGSIYAVLCAVTALLFRRRAIAPALSAELPPVSVLKPIHGLEKDLAENLRSACRQDYPQYQVVLSTQRLDDPALPTLRAIADEFGPARVTLAVADSKPVINGKIQNLLIGMSAARHDVLLISDSDVRLRPDYLRAIVAPLADPAIGCVCTLYRAVRAERWYEKLELLSLNADFTANLIFATVTGASSFCVGASVAFRRDTLNAIGGFSALGDYLAEDYRMGQRIEQLGRRIVILPYFVDTMVDLKTFSQWWGHQLYWDQTTKAARPTGFLATVITRAVPFALVYAALRLFDPLGLTILAAATAIRLATAACVLWFALADREGLRALWLLPVRDIFGLASWALALTKRDFIWRGNRFGLERDGRIVPRGTS